MPKEVVERAKEILAQLEDEHLDAEGRPKMAQHPARIGGGPVQLTLFAPMEHPLLDEIRHFDVNATAPLAALERSANGPTAWLPRTKRASGSSHVGCHWLCQCRVARPETRTIGSSDPGPTS